MTRPRYIRPGQMVFVTLACVGRSFRFLPTKDVRESLEVLFWHYAGIYGLEVHEFKFMGNHMHLLCTDVRGRLPDFMRDFCSHVSRQLNAIRGTVGTNIEKGYRLQVPTDDAKIVEHSAYSLANAGEAGLVDTIAQWKGPHSHELEYGEEIRVRRPECGMWKHGGGPSVPRRWRSRGRAAYRGRSKVPEVVVGRLVRPPVHSELSDAELRRKIRDEVARREAEAAQRRREAGHSAMGMGAVLRQSYLDIPNKPREMFENNPRVSGKDPNKRYAKLREILEFEGAYRLASEEFRAGRRDVVFPYGTWKMVRIFRARVARPPP